MPIYSDELQDQLARIDSLQQQIDALRPLPPDVQARIFQKFRLDWNYHSNSIEGNSLTYGETVAFIMEGVTAKGKPLKDHLDLRGHNQAIDVLQDMIRNAEAELTERDIRELHSIIMAEPYEVTVETSAGPQRRLIEPGQYKTMPNHTLTGTGETHYYATPEETPGKMHDLIEWYRSHRAALHPLVLAAQFHHRFVAIHPFDDGNGRMTRLLTNMLLMKAGYPPIVVKTEEKREYYAVLSQADAGVEAPLLEYFAERLIRSLDIYLKGARGEDINDDDDLDKEIALLKKSVSTDIISRKEINPEQISGTIINFFNKCFPFILDKHLKISDLFHNPSYGITVFPIPDSERPVNYTGSYFEEQNDVKDRMFLENIASAISATAITMYKNKGLASVKIDFVYSKFKQNPEHKNITSNIFIIFEDFVYKIRSTDGKDIYTEYYSKIYNNIDCNSIAKETFTPVIIKIKDMIQQ
ncbi:Fic family protein [Hymenobacter gummosus]|uniref:Fic family protein n=1 Tax=Hymenobacter gummosus TaxID=1776032 RepID=A0A3S0IP78_9BACT|nr:Fic family protein [Hymenobacter gummosus]RTQ50278.1 Fic family protein [Hymenobacter gummosus]